MLTGIQRKHQPAFTLLYRIPGLLPCRQAFFQHKDLLETTFSGDTRRISAPPSGGTATVEYQQGVFRDLGERYVLFHLSKRDIDRPPDMGLLELVRRP